MARRKGGVMMEIRTVLRTSPFPHMSVRLTPNARGTPTRTLRIVTAPESRKVLTVASTTNAIPKYFGRFARVARPALSVRHS